MSNLKQLSTLEQGVAAWNKWRKRNPTIGAELAGADLRGADLRKADLRNANLSHANLTEANLTGANLSRGNLFEANLSRAILLRVNLREANLREANLESADLSLGNLVDANLSRANLTATNLRKADLKEANFSAANLTEANLSGTDLRWAILNRATIVRSNFNKSAFGHTSVADTDLSSARGLDSIRHDASSSVSLDTILKSKGRIPERFLRGVGVPEDFITYMDSLVGKPFEFYSCFISYSSKDQAFAGRLVADLQKKGVRCWYAPAGLKIGEKLRPQIDEAIRVYDKLLLIISEHSVRSEWVETEVNVALEREHNTKSTVLFPVRLDDSVMKTKQRWAAAIRQSRQIGDFRNWKDHAEYREAFSRLMRDLSISFATEAARREVRQ